MINAVQFGHPPSFLHENDTGEIPTLSRISWDYASDKHGHVGSWFLRARFLKTNVTLHLALHKKAYVGL